MRLRTVAAGVVLALVGVAGGFAVGNILQDDSAAIALTTPVPADSPSYPVNEYDVLPDPGIAPLDSTLPSHDATFQVGPYRLQAVVPDGWRRVPLGDSTWNFAPPDNPLNSYVLRIQIVAGDRQSLSVAKGSRILGLQSAVTERNLAQLSIESETDDGFVASYLELIEQGSNSGHRRVTMQRWLVFPDATTAAYATVAVTGRESDRVGMADLLERVGASARIPAPRTNE
jgi:hypothetical protein